MIENTVPKDGYIIDYVSGQEIKGTPEEATTINSEFFIRYKKANREEKKETTGKVNMVKLRKL